MKTAAIGIDIGGTNVKLGLLSRAGKVIARDSFATGSAAGRPRMFEALSEHVHRLKSLASKKGLKVEGVGVGLPGAVDVERGFVYFFPNIPGWENAPFKTLLSRRTGLPVRVDNDANAMAFGEYCFGAGRSARCLVALTLGTGIGGGIVLDGKLYHGPKFSAAEIGHLTVDPGGPRCACGNRGCVETYVGNGYFVREIRRRIRAGEKSVLARWVREGKKELTPLLAAQAARRGDRLAKAMWSRATDHLGTALAGLVNILNPDRIVLGGGIAQNRELIFKPVKAVIKKKAFPIAAASVRVVPAKLGTDAGWVGAAALLFGERGDRAL